MTLEGQFPGKGRTAASKESELRFSGFIKKGKPFFAPLVSKEPAGPRNGLLEVLNQDQNLLDECSDLEVEYLKIRFDSRQEMVKIRVRPYGGSFLKIVIPPLKYHVVLVKEQAVLILSVMKKIASLLQE